jgi:hypothetical protein
MSSHESNRDLYLAVAGLIERHRAGERGLEEYLRALWRLAQGCRDRPALAVTEFIDLLDGAFTLPAAPFEEAWRSRHAQEGTITTGFAGWEARLVRQVVDLREMAERGLLDNEMRYFGINAPRGSRWYNFDPCTFLECATAGSFGGWQPGDDTGREYVPGPVAVLGEDGRLTSRDPRDIPNPVVPLVAVSWEKFRDFLGDGQWYE